MSRLPSAGRTALALAVASALAAPSPAECRKTHGAPATIVLDGQRTEVRWTDGDSFHVESGPLRGMGTRVVGYNTLEAYGPVHRIGTLTPDALHRIAAGSAALAAGAGGRCATLGKRDGYGRPLVACPDAALALVRAGHAMVYAVDGPADPALLAAQRGAQARGEGLWAGGVPPELLTSLHAAGERSLGAKGAYDRLVDTRTGATRVRPHTTAYRTCEEVCLGEGPARTCMVYVPFERRYRDRPACLVGE